MSSGSGSSTIEMQGGLIGSSQIAVNLTGKLTKPRQGISLQSDAGCADTLLFDIAFSWRIHKEEAKKRSWRISLEGVEKEKSSADSAASNSTEEVLLDASVELLPGLDEVPDLDVLQFVALPTNHIFLETGEIAKPLVQALVRRHVCTLGLPWLDAVEHLDALLANLPPSSPLRHFFFFFMRRDAHSKNSHEADAEMKRILHAFKSTSFLPEGVAMFLRILSPRGFKNCAAYRLTWHTYGFTF